MQFKIKYAASLFLLCATLVACNKTDLQREQDPQGREPIVLSVGLDSDSPTAATKASATAVITDGTNKTMQNFAINTKIFMVMMSEMSDPAAPVGYEDYGYKGPRASIQKLYTVCRGDVDGGSSDVVFDEKNQHYWDDAHARSSILSIWAFAQQGIPSGTGWLSGSFDVPNPLWDHEDPLTEYKPETFSTATTYYGWRENSGSKGAIYPCIEIWKTSHNTDAHVQDGTSMKYQDLLFTNNLADNRAYSKPDGRLKFNFTSHLFPRGGDAQMKFYHAMSKITIHIKKGDGFTMSDPFEFPSGKNVMLSGLNTEGTFNIKEGEFQMIKDRYDITKIYQWTTPSTGDAYTLEALAVPNIHQFMTAHEEFDEGSRFVENATNVMIEFTIDGNTYKIKSGVLYDALKDLEVGPSTNQIKKCTDRGNYIPMEAGKNYVFTFTIGKQGINNISATLADWVNVTAAEQTPSNAYVHLSLKRDEGSAVNTSDPKVDIYRAKDPTTYTGGDNYNDWAQYGWEKGYTVAGAKATLNQTSVETVYNAIDASSSKQWYWPDNNTYYHFRTINKGLTVTAGTNDVVGMYSGPINDTYHETNISTAFADGKFNDYIWGAPFKSTAPAATVYSSTTGFCNNANKADGQLYKGIGSTKDNILLIEHHMMSNIYVDLETSDGSLYDDVVIAGATVKLVRYAKEAKLQMGNGLVTGYSNYDNGTGTSMTVDVHAEEVGIPAYDYSYRVVPQSLTNSSKGAGTKVGLVITTTDGNVYIIEDLSTIKERSSETLITDWFPGKKYFYKFVLKKTGITKLEATIVDWENVEASEDEITIK